MRSEDLEKWQVERVQKSITQSVRYFNALRDRVEKNFAPSDELYIKVVKASDALHSLVVTLHYLSCSHGVGKPAKRGTAPH